MGSDSGLPMPPDPMSQLMGKGMTGMMGGGDTSGGAASGGTGTGIDTNGVLAATLGGQIDKTDDLSKQNLKPLTAQGQQKPYNPGSEGQSAW